MLKIIAVSAALALVAGSTAAAPVGHGTSVVRLSDLDLSRPADAQRLQRRLETAALEACGAREGSVRMIRTTVLRSDCYRETLADASLKVRTSLASR